ncbi:MAG: tRNA pseudouridine(38-40) synthase TruA [Planctomycetia bacterium]|nr:tRNA pseudouridine(38-40) synthase TruA [Planctomycetia bacterium]
MRTIKLTLAYDGAAYRGWQRQPGNRTLQDELEQALQRIVGERVVVSGSGRTDSGVHALGQTASFHTEATLTPAAFRRALNAELPNDIVVVAAEEAAPGFHARKQAKRKRYRYIIHNSRTADVFRRGTSWHYCYGKLDAEAMHRAAQHWRGTHDFRSFETQWPQRSSSVRTVLDIDCRRLVAPDEKVIYFEVEADGFLYNMVRTMVGTLVEVGRGRKPESWTQELVAAGDRKLAGMKVPAQGLFLLSVHYDDGPAS